jgi:hypothetical protein
VRATRLRLGLLRLGLLALLRHPGRRRGVPGRGPPGTLSSSPSVAAAPATGAVPAALRLETCCMICPLPNFYLPAKYETLPRGRSHHFDWARQALVPCCSCAAHRVRAQQAGNSFAQGERSARRHGVVTCDGLSKQAKGQARYDREERQRKIRGLARHAQPTRALPTPVGLTGTYVGVRRGVLT